MLGDAPGADGQWRSAYSMRQEAAGKQWHPRFGWLPKSHVARYDEGHRFYKGQWLSPEREAELRGALGRGWQVESEHFTVTSYAGLEAGVVLSLKLERLHRVWQQLFIRYLLSEADLAKWLDGRAAPPAAKRHDVVFFRDRPQYVDALRAKQPRIDGTLGIYFDHDRRSYFYAGREVDEAAVVFHEAAHQLFQESRRTPDNVGRLGNFWIVEGIACYLESLHFHDDFADLGSPGAGRLPAARQRLLADGFYEPLATVVRWNTEAIQQRPDIGRLYSQFAGQATFLMQGAEGKYREPLLAYLSAVYHGRAQPETLARLTGAGYDQLDLEYRAFLAELVPRAALAPPDAVTPLPGE